MNDPAQAWLKRFSAHPGVMACGIRYPQGQCLSQSFTSRFAQPKLEELWNQLFDAAKAFKLRRISVERLCWKFERYHFWYVARPDGLAFGLILKASTANGQAPSRRILQEFLEPDWPLAAA